MDDAIIGGVLLVVFLAGLGSILTAYIRYSAIKESQHSDHDYTNSRNTTLTVGVWKCTCGKEVSNKEIVCPRCGSWKCRCNSINAKTDFSCKCGNWKCTCGILNSPVAGSCACGKRKRDVEAECRNVTK